jgi:hypothetical protein
MTIVEPVEAPADIGMLGEIKAFMSERSIAFETCNEPEEVLTEAQIQAKLDELIDQVVPVLESSAEAERLAAEIDDAQQPTCPDP